MKVLVINAGSSSLKYQLMDPETGKVFAKGLCERIGLDGKFTYKPQVEGKETIKAADVAMPTHSEAIQTVLNALVDPQNGVISSMKEIDAVGHRVVHGGETFASSVLINDEVLKAVEELHASGSPAQPRQYHRHRGLPQGAGRRRAAGGCVRHRFPPDHAGACLSVQHPLQVL